MDCLLFLRMLFIAFCDVLLVPCIGAVSLSPLSLLLVSYTLKVSSHDCPWLAFLRRVEALELVTSCSSEHAEGCSTVGPTWKSTVEPAPFTGDPSSYPNL